MDEKLTLPCIDDYLEACDLVCEKCTFNEPEGSFCALCPVKYSREKLLNREDSYEN